MNCVSIIWIFRIYLFVGSIDGHSVQLSEWKKAKLPIHHSSSSCNNFYVHILFIYPRYTFHIFIWRPNAIDNYSVLRYSANIHIAIDFNHICNFITHYSQAVCNTQFFSKVWNYFLYFLYLPALMILSLFISILCRNNFLIRNNWNASDLSHKTDSIRCIKFVARQHLALTDVADQLNFCYSFQVKFTATALTNKNCFLLLN